MNRVTRTVPDGTTTEVARIDLQPGEGVGGMIVWTLKATDGTDRKVAAGWSTVAAANNGGSLIQDEGKPSKEAVADTKGNGVDVTWTFSMAGTLVSLEITTDVKLGASPSVELSYDFFGDLDRMSPSHDNR